MFSQHALASTEVDPLEANGVEVQSLLQLDLLGNATGGLTRDVYLLGIASLSVTWDLGKAFDVVAPRLHALGLATFGGNPSQGMGDAQVISNIEGMAGLQLFHFWIEQAFAEDRLVLRTGIYDLDDVLFLIESGLVFTHSSHGLNPTISGAGPYGVPTFPTAGFAGHVAVQDERAYGVVAVAQGTPRHPFTTLRLPPVADPGAFMVAEMGVRQADAFKYAIGGWAYTGARTDLISGEARTGDRGAYALLEQIICLEGWPRIGLFARLGFASPSVNPIAAYAGGGVVSSVPGRSADSIGLAVAAASPGGAQHLEVWEIAVELTYVLRLFGAVDLQPNVHYVVRPGFEGADVLAIGARLLVQL